MLVSLTYTHAQDSLGNVITRTTIVILQHVFKKLLWCLAVWGKKRYSSIGNLSRVISKVLTKRVNNKVDQTNFTGLIRANGEARAKKRARPPATCRKASTGKTGADTGPEGCGSPAVFPSPCLGDSSTKTTIMTVHVNKIMQAAPSQRRIISISEASNQLLFHSQKFFVEWILWRINIFLKSCSRSKKLQPGGKPNSFAFRNPGRPRRSINCSRDGSRTASRFAIQINRDAWSK